MVARMEQKPMEAADERDKVFEALADPSRRAMLDRLRLRNGQAITELAEGLPMTRQAVSKHLAVLERANLVVTVRKGRERLHFLNPVPLHTKAGRWLERFANVPLDHLVDEAARPSGEK
jgi:DNA-binding transcriptional ArsR family regulator